MPEQEIDAATITTSRPRDRSAPLKFRLQRLFFVRNSLGVDEGVSSRSTDRRPAAAGSAGGDGRTADHRASFRRRAAMPVPSGGLRAAPAAVPMATRWHRWHNSVMMAQITALLKSYGIGSRCSPDCDAMQEVLRGGIERNVERPLSNDGCNGLASARNRRESAFRSWPSCKPATRVGGDDRHRSVRSGGGVGRFRARGVDRLSSTGVQNLAPLMQPCLIAHAAMLLQAGGSSAASRAFLKERRRSGFLRLANALSALIPCSVAKKRLLDAMLPAVPR